MLSKPCRLLAVSPFRRLTVDPLERPKFGGEAQDLEIIASYVRAMGDLEKRSKSHAETDEEAKEWRKKGKGKGKKTDEGAAE